MTHQTILTKGMDKAVEQGWSGITPSFNWIKEDRKAIVEWLVRNEQYPIVLFNHDFAKALWPGWDLAPEAAKFIGKQPRPNFYRHVQQMVISDDPIIYLGENI